MKKIVFLTGTRADFGKLKPLINEVEINEDLECHVFVTGMHTLKKFGDSYFEVEKQGYKNIYKYINQSQTTDSDTILSNTITGFSNYIKELKPDMIVVHGDRIEALAGAIVGTFNNIRVAHIEGGEVSGTLDEIMRHAITKLSHIHFVSNDAAKKRLIQMGEKETNIFTIGSPDIDIMLSNDLPDINYVKTHYDIPFNDYAILIYHPVTTELDDLKYNVKQVIEAVRTSNMNYIVIYPNNDEGSNIIIDAYKQFKQCNDAKMYPSIRFENFLTLLKNAKFIIGNSSCGIMEAEVYGVPTIDIGSRQSGRSINDRIIHVPHDYNNILAAIYEAKDMHLNPTYNYGKGDSANQFIKILKQKEIWNIPIQKHFIDID